MTAAGFRIKLYDLFTGSAHGHAADPYFRGRRHRGGQDMIGLAIAMFIALFGWGAQYFGWSDPEGKVQLALFTTFILGAVCGYKSRS